MSVRPDVKAVGESCVGSRRGLHALDVLTPVETDFFGGELLVDHLSGLGWQSQEGRCRHVELSEYGEITY